MIEPISLSLGIFVGLLAGAMATYWILMQKHESHRSTYIRQAAELNLHKEAVETKEQQFERQQKQLYQLHGEIQRLEAEKKYFIEEKAEKDALIANIDQEWRIKLEHQTQQILEKRTGTLTQYHEEHLKTLLQPFKDQINHFEKKIEQVYLSENRERIQLQKELEMLVSLNQQLSEDAQNLTEALKGDNKLQGNWGEMILRKILEASGLRKEWEYKEQVSCVDPDGKRLQPDVVIYLPGNKHLIVDAKVSLKAYNQVMESVDIKQQDLYIKQHVDSISRHIKSLSDKHYYLGDKLQVPEFVFLFMPIEPAFSLAIQHKPELLEYAWDRKIVLVSPSSLMATLKTVASVWQIAFQNQHAHEIALQGGMLYDKFVSFVEELDGLGKYLDKAQKAHVEVMKKMQTGNGNLLSRAERLKELGVKTHKSLKQ